MHTVSTRTPSNDATTAGTSGEMELQILLELQKAKNGVDPDLLCFPAAWMSLEFVDAVTLNAADDGAPMLDDENVDSAEGVDDTLEFDAARGIDGTVVLGVDGTVALDATGVDDTIGDIVSLDAEGVGFGTDAGGVDDTTFVELVGVSAKRCTEVNVVVKLTTTVNGNLKKKH